jgi:hypothetical protein
MKTCGKTEGIPPPFLTSALDVRGVISFMPRPIYSQGKSPITNWIEDCGEEIFFCPYRKSNPDTLAYSPSLYRLSYPG